MMATQTSQSRSFLRAISIILLFAALFNVSVHATASEQAVLKTTKPYLKPSTFVVRADLNISQPADSASIDIQITKNSTVFAVGKGAVLAQRAELEALIQTLSRNTTTFDTRRRSADQVWGRYGKGSDGLDEFNMYSEEERDENLIAVNLAMGATFSDLDALHQFLTAVWDAEDIEVSSLEWKLDSDSVIASRRALRRQALAELVKRGEEYAEDLDVILVEMDEYTEDNMSQRRFHWDDSNYLFDWQEIKNFYEKMSAAGTKAANVTTTMEVSCKFYAA